jgi:methionine synthase I (cobalamin-dependent)
MNRYQERIEKPGILVADGATGTMLQLAGLPKGHAPEIWNLENPQAILELHKSYIDAGADIILTNTFGGSRARLDREGLASQAVEVNRTAASLACQAAGNKVLVFGDIGPTGQLLAPLGNLTADEARDAFAEQAAGLAEGGVDAILIETMSDLAEVFAAVEGVRKACSLPIWVSLSFDTRGHTMMGVKPGKAAKEIWALGVDGIGANCGRSLPENLEAINAMHSSVPEAVLLAKPNAGLPGLAEKGQAGPSSSEVIYHITPQIMAEYAVRFAESGVKIFGGCCGSTPDHIREAAKVLHNLTGK